MSSSPKLSALLIFSPISPPSVLEELHKLFDTVYYYPLPPFAPIAPTTSLPTPEEYANTDVILSFTVPPNLLTISQAPNLKLFQALSAGVGHLTSTPFFKSLKEEDEVIFASASGIHVSTIAEHVIATTLMLWHKLHTLLLVQVNEKRWANPRQLFGGNFVRELRGMTVGIIGYGHIGRETARLSLVFGSKIHALTRSGAPTPNTGFTLPSTGDPDGSIPFKYFTTQSKSSIKEFFESCDVVVNTLPALPETEGFVGEEEFRAMKGDAVFVNIGRGDTVVTNALLAALKGVKSPTEEDSSTGSLRIGAASIDVSDPEPLPDGHELFTLPNVIITPHSSAMSTSYFHLATELLGVNVGRLREGKGALNAVRGKGEF